MAGRHSKSRAKRIVYDLVKNDVLILVGAATLFLVIVIAEVKLRSFNWGDLNPAPGLVEMIIIAVLGWVVLALKRLVLNYLEDDVKLTDDYELLIKTYLPEGISVAGASFVVHDNSGASNQNRMLLFRDHPELKDGTSRLGTLDETVFPVVRELSTLNHPVTSIQVDDSKHAYEPPAVIQSNFGKLIVRTRDRTSTTSSSYACWTGRARAAR